MRDAMYPIVGGCPEQICNILFQKSYLHRTKSLYLLDAWLPLMRDMLRFIQQPNPIQVSKQISHAQGRRNRDFDTRMRLNVWTAILVNGGSSRRTRRTVLHQ